ncbi:MIP-related peptides-like [Dreissena polymorpha]|uniref:Uncharacterized protein n=1 Tax=Dreissena polymorpha TaxID=45954 RepID=A0A9D4MH80_DREPO|nr:MIP-related peptides-like [Dreissena polymorpha]XP_052266966.1 MIP-related peptides-like [Dreissena polymorpha]KAH3876518.1 hypothetical protein DPMN_000363 [Dreissena polymorpha]
MAPKHTGILLATFLASLTLQLSHQSGSDDSNAQAAAALAAVGSHGASETEGESNDTDLIRLVRRYVPRFVGKRTIDSIDSDETENKLNEEELKELEIAVQSYLEDSGLDVKDNFEYNLGDTDELLTDKSALEKQVENDEISTDEVNDGEYSSELSQGDKRYIPQFVGKRSRTYGGRQYNPMFVGKRYRPMFVGKRYRPMFVGKRYRPMFVGKRYRPMFVGKRYKPMFVGKRYRPMFVGKRYQPKFIGKRYQPKFIGKRDVQAVQNQNYDSTSPNNSRKKRSVYDETETMDSLNYIPARYTKRFVAPEFIGRRDSLSSILSALDALEYGRHPVRSTSKRFEAPMFIGKRSPYVMELNLDPVGPNAGFADEYQRIINEYPSTDIL